MIEMIISEVVCFCFFILLLLFIKGKLGRGFTKLLFNTIINFIVIDVIFIFYKKNNIDLN